MKKTFAEFISTYCLVLFGTGAVIVDSVTEGKVTLAGISIITGLVVAIMIKIFGKWSGAHMNPAVTIGLVSGGKFFKKDVVPYVLAQIAGACAASATLKFIFPYSLTLGETTPSVDIILAFTMEFMITFLLMMTILYSAKKKWKQEAWIIGSFVTLAIFISGPFCGGSMNPARSFAPAIMNHNLQSQWIYWTAPVLGAVFATFIFNLSKKNE